MDSQHQSPSLREALSIVCLALGYNNEVDDQQKDPRVAHIYRAARHAGVSVFYSAKTNSFNENHPITPVACIATAQSDAAAREIRRLIWCLGKFPFLIIVQPNLVRAYSGTIFDRKNDGHGLLAECDVSIEEVQTRLSELTSKSINSGRIWKTYRATISTNDKVDKHLLRNLDDLGHHLIDTLLLKPTIAHALIGKYIYIRYLLDKNIVTKQWLETNFLDVNVILSKNATLEGLKSFSDAIETRFHGSIFPLPFHGADAPSNIAVSYVAQTIIGGEPWSEQPTFEFDIYNFRYIPVETLSIIYEQFLNQRNEQKSAGAYYTPEFLAEYTLADLCQETKWIPRMRILDPACGSGVFLVVAYRQLVEQHIADNQGNRPSAQLLRRLLIETIFGVEKNLEACYVTEFSLLLMLLTYISPPELDKNETFKFPALHGSNIFHADFFDDHSDFAKQNLKFDWVVGNPPWYELDPKDSNNWAATTYIERLEHEGKFVARYRIHEAFVWRSSDYLTSTGWIGLIIHATTLTNDESEDFRKSFFERHEVARLSNFSNLAYRLFPSSQAPAATLIFRPTLEQSQRSIVHYGPFVGNQLALQSLGPSQGIPLLTIYATEIHYVSADDARSGSAYTWKLALWGTYRDQQTLSKLRQFFPVSLRSITQEKKWNLQLGLQLRPKDSREDLIYTPELSTYKLLDTKLLGSRSNLLQIPSTALHDVSPNRAYIRKRGGTAGLSIIKAPHLFISTNCVAYSAEDFILPHPQIGLSAPAEDSNYLKALSLVMSSSFVRYLLFFKSSSWGIFTSTIGLDAANNIQLPRLSDNQIINLASNHDIMVQQSLSKVQRQFNEMQDLKVFEPTSVPQTEIDNAVANALNLPNSLAFIATEFMEIRYSLNKGKYPKKVSQKPTPHLLDQYLQIIKEELEAFTGIEHSVKILEFENYLACIVSLVSDSLEDESSSISEVLSQLWIELGTYHSQWIYSQSNFTFYSDSALLLLKPNRILDWTRTQALLDSDHIVSELVSLGEQQ